MGYKIQGTTIIVTRALVMSHRLPKFIVPTQRGDSMHFNRRSTAIQRAKLHRSFGFWRVKVK